MADRTIRWEGFHNTRDLGGLPTTDGGFTRYKALIRSAELRFVTAAGWRAAFDEGVRTVLDLRNDDEADPGSAPGTTLGAGTFAVKPPKTSAKPPAGLDTLRIPIDDIDDTALWQQLNNQGLNGTPLYFRPFIEAKPQRIAAVLTAIAQARPGGVIFHCGAGRDRTGLVSLLLLSLAQVLPDAIAEDYELSLDQVEPLWAALGIKGREPSMHDVLRERGTTVRAVVLGLIHDLDVRKILRSAGTSDVTITKLRSRLVE